MERRNRIVTREELYGEVWGEPYRKSDRSVDVYVGKLRQKLENAVPGGASSTPTSGSAIGSPMTRSAPTFTSFLQRGDSSITDSPLPP